MWVLICYDIATVPTAGPKRLRQIARACCDFGQRVQFSVFECNLTPTEWTELRLRLLAIIDPTVDSLRFYFLGDATMARAEHYGAKPPIDFDGPLIV